MAGKLVIIDGNAILHRAFHALPPLKTKNGEPINAVYGLVSMLLKVVSDLKPSEIAVAFDEKEPTFRHKELPTYQAQRPPMHADLSSQFSKARDFLKAAGIPVYSKPGYEADDVIGTIVSRAILDTKIPDTREIKKKKSSIEYPLSSISEVVIVTGDRDQLQLVDDQKGIKLYMPVVGLANAKMYGEAETVERMGVPPSQIVNLKSLTGDASDNYFGVAGIGPKTAINLLTRFGTLQGIYEHLSDIPDKVKEKLERGRESAEQSLMLATIIRDVPIDIDFNAMSKWNISGPEVLKLFEEFGFKTLTKRVQEIGKKLEDEKQGALF